MPTPKLSARKHRRILDLAAAGKSSREIARAVGVSSGTAVKFAKTPLPGPAAAELPASWAEDYPPFALDGARRVLVLSDVHIPFHVPAAVEAAVEAGRKDAVDCVYLNGDALDFHQVSRYDHDGSKLTYTQEVESGKQFFRYLRGKFPKARIVFKEGNHEERLDKYILSRAPALFGLEDCTLGSLLGLAGLGVELVRDQRVVMAGRLRLIHGHEYGGGVNAPVSAARWLMLRARKPAMCGHLHQTSEQIESNIDGEQMATWSVGCLCGLSPKYRRLSQKTNHGFALLGLAASGEFEVRNLRVRNGKVA